jgi:ketosteroid isomerase-like protein
VSDPVVTRVRFSEPSRLSRTADERLAARFPWLLRCAAARVARLSPRSRVRRALLRRGLISGWAAFNRGDFELMLLRYAPDVEFQFTPGQRTLGLDGTYRGHEELLAGLEQAGEAWEAIEFSPAYVLDFGDRVLCLGFNHSRARASGVELEGEIAQLVTAPGGLIVQDRSWFSWAEGLRAVGLDRDAVDLP